MATTYNVTYQVKIPSENFTDYGSIDLSDECFNVDCIWDRERRNRLSILRPLTLILSLISFIGIIGNIFVIIVFSQTVQKRTSTYLVLLLGITDLIACSIVIPGTLLKEWLVKFKLDLICKVWELLRNSDIISSAMTLAAIAFDRFLLVYRNNKQNGSKHVTIVMLLVTLVTSFGLGVMPMLGMGTYMESFQGLVNIQVCMPNNLQISSNSLQIYWQIVTGLFSLLILTIIILYMLIFFMVYKHSTGTGRNGTVGNNLSVSGAYKGKMASILLFVGFSRSDRQITVKKQTVNQERSNKRHSIIPQKLSNIFKAKKSRSKTEVIKINIIGNSSASTDSAVARDPNSEPRPGPSGISPAELSCKLTNNLATGLKPHNQSLSVPISTNQKQALIRNRSAHIKTTKVLCMITTVYFIAFLPMFLITHGVMDRNEIMFYLYFINNAANPIIYSFMNNKFRQDVKKMFRCNANRVVPN